MIVTVYFDGLCEPNPGGVATYGWIVRDLPGRGEPPEMGCGRVALQNATNNVAEYTALGKALAFIAGNVAGALEPDDQILICGDSQLVIQQLNGHWRCNDARLQALLGRCRALLKEIGCAWAATWIGRDLNASADALSRAAYVDATNRPAPVREKKPNPKSTRS